MKFVTFNIRCQPYLDGINAFIHRAGMIYDKIQKETPDVVCFQEVVPFQLEFLQPVSTYSGGAGDSFVATMLNEQASGSSIILPAGTVVRGSIAQVNTAKRFSRGAKLYLDFDHVVTPTGRQIPLDMAVCQFDRIYYDGGLYKNLGYGESVQKNYEQAVKIAKDATEYGKKAEDSAPGLQPGTCRHWGL